MVGDNYKKGRGREFRELYKILAWKNTIKGARYYGSKGPTDIWWVNWQGKFNEAQVKYTTQKGKKPYISKKELSKLKQYALRVKGVITVYLIMAEYRKKGVWRKLN